MAGDRVSQEYLKAELLPPGRSPQDLPDTPLCFGRLDYAETGYSETGISDDGVAGHSFHIGRRHVHAPDGTPAVIDWRAPCRGLFYRASGADPMNLALRRRFGFSGGELTAYEDEPFTTDRSGKSVELAKTSQILIDEIERPRSGPMRDIVATIQPDRTTSCGPTRADRLRPGRAGHREDRRRAAPGRLPAVRAPGTGPAAWRGHWSGRTRPSFPTSRNVLPALGELDVTQTTVGELVQVPGVGAGARVRHRDGRGAQGRRADGRGAPASGVGVGAAAGAGRGPGHAGPGGWRVAAWETEELVHELRHRGVRYGAARELLEHRIAHVILTQMGRPGRPATTARTRRCGGRGRSARRSG